MREQAESPKQESNLNSEPMHDSKSTLMPTSAVFSNGSAAPLVDALVQKLIDGRVTEEEFFQQFRQIVKRCGFILYRNLAKDNTRESWYVTSQGNTRFEVISSMDYLNVIPDWLRRQDLLGSS
ncbi:hypothetical protein [aff. Roholtiella sp. LEGE 12411]|uniref:hypothetical protein n=1 Tax=aff. Roholtiella sp. LEGE 12411 TaxID=1828822 RepID=UPI00188225F5|nr:hypothetical protein [aff. Roholtiella sp. LEGE 12411]MBE9038704.1 hypothetical protein [aff. Roholtiella sp. LEGE 12411]